MATTIIMTEVKDSRFGNYVKFNVKGEGRLLAEVDRRDKRYVIFSTYNEIGTRTQKDAAIKFAQDYIRGFIPDAEFKWNVMVQRIRRN